MVDGHVHKTTPITPYDLTTIMSELKKIGYIYLYIRTTLGIVLNRKKPDPSLSLLGQVEDGRYQMSRDERDCEHQHERVSFGPLERVRAVPGILDVHAHARGGDGSRACLGNRWCRTI